MGSRSGEFVVEKTKRHDRYYIQGGDIVFLVESHLFRVHKYFFERESAVFRERLALATPPGQAPKGTSDTNPYPLEDVTSVDFARFLWVFYNPLYSLYDAGAEDWTSILKLAFLWRFHEVKNLAVRELEKLYIPPVPKISLYQKYDVDRSLLIQSYAFLTTRPDPLTMSEGLDLGLETSLLIAQARERARGLKENGGHSPVCIDEADLQTVLKDVFQMKEVGAFSSPTSPRNGQRSGAVPGPSSSSGAVQSPTNGHSSFSTFAAFGNGSTSTSPADSPGKKIGTA